MAILVSLLSFPYSGEILGRSNIMRIWGIFSTRFFVLVVVRLPPVHLKLYDRTPTGGRDMRLGRGYRFALTLNGYDYQTASSSLDMRGEIAVKTLCPAPRRHSWGER